MKKILLASLLLLCSAKAFADEGFVRCENCDNYQAAAENAYLNAGEYTMHVYDVASEVIKSYYIDFNLGGGGGGLEDRASFGKTVTLITTRSSVKASFDGMINAIRDLKTSNASDADIPATVVRSGWELLSHHQNQQAFLNYIKENRSVYHLVMDKINHFSGVANAIGLKVKIPLSFKLENGAEIIIVVEFTKVDSSGLIDVEYVIDFKNSRDENGNPILIQRTGTPHVGPYQFNNGSRSQYEFLQAVTRSQRRYFISGGGHSTSCRIEEQPGGEVRVICVISN